MMPSPLRHPIAVLRQTLGVSQARLGELSGCSGRTIQAVELGKLALGEGLARRIADATGVSVGWLLDGDPTIPPNADCPGGGRSAHSIYTRDVYEAHRAHLEVDDRTADGRGRQYTLEQSANQHEYGNELDERDAVLVARCEALLAKTRGAENAAIVRWKMKKLLEQLDQENPVSSLAHRESRRSRTQRA